MLLDIVDKLISAFKDNKELIEGYKQARGAIVEALSKITTKERQETAETTDGAEDRASYAVSEDYSNEMDNWYKSGQNKKSASYWEARAMCCKGLAQ